VQGFAHQDKGIKFIVLYLAGATNPIHWSDEAGQLWSPVARSLEIENSCLASQALQPRQVRLECMLPHDLNICL
jgi:hypothetical protein